MNTWRGAYLRLTATLRQAWLRRGITQAQAARRIGRCTRTIIRFEAGEADIQFAQIFSLADMVGVRIEVTVLSPSVPSADAEHAV